MDKQVQVDCRIDASTTQYLGNCIEACQGDRRMSRRLWSGAHLGAIVAALGSCGDVGPGPRGRSPIRGREGRRQARGAEEVPRLQRGDQGSEEERGLLHAPPEGRHLYAEIKPHQFDQPFLAPITIARGSAMAGQPLNFGDEWVAGLQPGRRQGPAHPPEHPLQGPAGHAAGEGGQAELHRLGPDGPADRQHQPRAAAAAS